MKKLSVLLVSLSVFTIAFIACPTDTSGDNLNIYSETYSINVNQRTLGGTIKANPTTAVAGTRITLSNIPAAGYTFNYYTVDGTALFANTFILSKNVTVSGVFTRTELPSSSFIVTFNANGGSEVSSQTVLLGGTVIPITTTRDGYTLDGWYKESTFTTKWNFATDTVTASLALYAKWNQNEPDTVIVTFDTGGVLWINPQYVYIGDYIDQPDIPTIMGYTFDNWYIDADHTACFSFSLPVMEDHIVYAKWTPITYTVVYDKNADNATGTMENSVCTYDVSQVPSVNGFSRIGYDFAGWNTKADGSGINYSAAGYQSFFNLCATQGETVTLYAKWNFFIGSGSFGGFQYTGTGLGLTITGYTGEYYKYIEIPSYIEGKPVTAIEEWAFFGKEWYGVTIPSGVTSIGDYAFGGNYLTSVTIPDSVTSIGDFAFADNYQLTSVTIPNSVTSIGASVFFNSQLTSVTIPDSVTSIGDFAFSNSQLTSVTIGSNVISIGDYAFWRNQLTSVTIPDSVTSIGEKAFYENQLTSVTIGSGVTSIGAVAFAYNQLTSVTIPDSVTSIGWSAFYYNKLTSVTIGSGVTSIEVGVFEDNQLTSVTIPNSVTSIGDEAFAHNQLTNITIGANVTLEGNSSFGIIGFENAYNYGGKLAGTYMRFNINSTTWIR
jgi:uncharacterized repeat protein (TIGR02543 family)